jgi:hypothetical protein
MLWSPVCITPRERCRLRRPGAAAGRRGRSRRVKRVAWALTLLPRHSPADSPFAAPLLKASAGPTRVALLLRGFHSCGHGFRERSDGNLFPKRRVFASDPRLYIHAGGLDDRPESLRLSRSASPAPCFDGTGDARRRDGSRVEAGGHSGGASTVITGYGSLAFELGRSRLRSPRSTRVLSSSTGPMPTGWVVRPFLFDLTDHCRL